MSYSFYFLKTTKYARRMQYNEKGEKHESENEKDLESAVISFLNSGNYDIIDIKYCVSTSIFSEEQIYCYSAMVIYNES